MIDVGNDWYIDVDEAGNYMPVKDYHRTTIIKRKDGTEVEKPLFSAPIGYFTSLSNTIKGLVKAKVKDALKDEEMGLSDAIKTIDEITGEFETMLDKALKGQ